MSRSAPKVPCPVCRAQAPGRSENPASPFCSERCRMADLGQWLEEAYRVPGPPADPQEVVDALMALPKDRQH